MGPSSGEERGTRRRAILEDVVTIEEQPVVDQGLEVGMRATSTRLTSP